MKYPVCPQCRNLTSPSSAFCLFCGKALRRGARSVTRESPASPRSVKTGSAIAQRAFSLLAVLLFLIVSVYPVVGAYAAKQSGNPLESPYRRSGNAFLESSGQYSVILFISEVKSEDPEAKAAADMLRSKQFGGTLTVSVNETGSGTVSIGQEFFSPEGILVSAFQDDGGNLSNNTLYGVVERDGMKISIVCVCADDGVSGFIWVDNAITHIEFLYFS